MARVGQFSAYTGPYGSPIPIAQPPNNVATPDPSVAAADAAKAAQDTIYQQLQNASRTFAAPLPSANDIYNQLKGL